MGRLSPKTIQINVPFYTHGPVGHATGTYVRAGKYTFQHIMTAI